MSSFVIREISRKFYESVKISHDSLDRINQIYLFSRTFSWMGSPTNLPFKISLNDSKLFFSNVSIIGQALVWIDWPFWNSRFQIRNIQDTIMYLFIQRGCIVHNLWWPWIIYNNSFMELSSQVHLNLSISTPLFFTCSYSKLFSTKWSILCSQFKWVIMLKIYNYT